MVKSSIPILEVMQLAQGRKKSAFATEEAQVKNASTSANLSNQLFQNSLKTPKLEQPNIESAEKLQKFLGDRPTGWQALASGMLEGYAHNQKKKSILDDRERLRKYNATLEKLQNVVSESGARLAEFRKRDQIKEGLTPYVGRMLDMMLEKAPPEQLNMAGTDIVRRYNEATGENWQYELSNGRSIAVVDPKTGESAIIPWEDMASPQLQEKVIMVDPSYQSQLARQQQMEDREFQREEQKLGFQERNVAANEMRAMNSDKKGDMQHAEDMERQTYLRLQELLKKGDPTRGGGIQALEWMGEHLPMNSPLTAEQQEYRQLLADLKGQRFKKYGYRNQAEFENIHTLPENVSKAEALKFVNNELKKLNGGNAASAGQTQSNEEQNDYVDNLKVKVKLPPAVAKKFGKEIVPMSLEDAEKAVQKGQGEIID